MGAHLRVLGVVPARGGSKGVPRKNIKKLGGKPLLQYTAEAALSAERISRTILSTEDPEIAEVGRACGLEVPFLRPPDLAQDGTPTLPVIQHVVRWVEAQGDYFNAICLLQPTTPLRTANDINTCIELLEQNDVDAVVTILPVPSDYNPHWVYFRDCNGLLRLSTGEEEPIPRRQSLPQAFHRSGSVYVTRREILMEHNSLYGRRLIGYLLNPKKHVSIDTPEDWRRAEDLLRAASI